MKKITILLNTTRLIENIVLLTRIFSLCIVYRMTPWTFQWESFATSAENAASSASPKLNPTRVGIILEGSIVMDTLTNLPQAMCLLFGFTYALHLQCPKCLKNTFIFIQQVMLNLAQSELPPKVQKLKNDLAV